MNFNEKDMVILYGKRLSYKPLKYYDCENAYSVSVEHITDNIPQNIIDTLERKVISFQAMIETTEKLKSLKNFIANNSSKMIFCNFCWASKYVPIKNSVTKEISNIYFGHHIFLLIPFKDGMDIDKEKIKKNIEKSLKSKKEAKNVIFNLINEFTDKYWILHNSCKMLVNFQHLIIANLKDMHNNMKFILNENSSIAVLSFNMWWHPQKQIDSKIAVTALKLAFLSSDITKALRNLGYSEYPVMNEQSMEAIIKNIATLCNDENKVESFTDLYFFLIEYNRKFWNDEDKSYFYEMQQNDRQKLIDIMEKLEKIKEKINFINGGSYGKIIAEGDTFEDTILTQKDAADVKAETFTFPKRIITESHQNIDAVGIDLGTSRCCVAVNRNNGIETVGLDNNGERLLPSYVAYDEENPKCGQVVVERLRYFSEATIFDSKRIIGKSKVVADKIWPFKVVTKDGKILLKVKTERGEIQQSATEVAAVLLKYVKEKAEQFQGKQLSNAVITFPSAFNPSQEEATIEAAKLAGWESVTLLPEPIAASIAYFIDRPIPNNSTLLLFDLGGGTLDVCIFKIFNNQIKFISKNGDSKLGGRDFDNLLMDYFLNKFKFDYGITNLGNKKYKLLIECQKVKHNLSVRNDDQIDVEDFDPSKNGFIKITQKQFHDMAVDLLNKIKNTIFAALYDSQFTANQISKVLQVGGGCRMPMIKQLLQDIFPSAEHCCEEHPDEVVAIGAAYYAYNIS